MQAFFNANFYSVVAAIALLAHLVIDWKQLFDWRNAKKRAGGLEFRQFLVCLTVFFVADVLWGFLARWQCPRLLYADTAGFFLTMALSVYFWTRFIVAYMAMHGGQRGRLLWIGRVLLAFFVGALAVNVFTGHFFTVDGQCKYVAGPVRQAAFSLLAAFNAYVSVAALPMMPRAAGALRRRCKMLIAVGLTMAAAILVQLGDPFLPIYSLGTLFALCFLHVFVVEDERDEMHRQELLAREYGSRLEAERRANQAKSLFFSSVSHDIRTPLNAIVGYSELLEHGAPDAAESARYVATIRSSARVLARLVDDVLDLSKLESGKLEIIEEPTVEMAHNGREALALLKRKPSIDFVLTDLWMPELDGRGLVQAIRADAALAHLPVHLVTADVEARAQATADGFTGLLLKPITLDGLLSLFV